VLGPDDAGGVLQQAGPGPRGGRVLRIRAIVDDRGLALDRARGRIRRGVLAPGAVPGVTIEQRLCRLALHHQRCDLVGVLLVRVAGRADAALQLHAAALLDDVRGLVRRGEQVGRVAEHDVAAGRIGLGAHITRRRRAPSPTRHHGGRTRAGSYRHGAAAMQASPCRGSRLVHRRAVAWSVRAPLNGSPVYLLDERLLSRSRCRRPIRPDTTV